LKLKEPGEVHRDLRVHAPVTAQTLALDVALVEGAARELDLPSVPPLAALTRGGGRTETLGLALHAALWEPDSSRLALESLLVELLAALWGEAAEEGSPAPVSRDRRAALRARELLHATVAEGIGLEELAAATGLGRFRLLRVFRREFGLPPYAYLTHLRVSRAKELLARGVPAIRVAQEVGLYDQSQLNRHFVRIVGVPPAAYARSVHGASTSPKRVRGAWLHPAR
jgi:AraC-like DNA-binding protein